MNLKRLLSPRDILLLTIITRFGTKILVGILDDFDGGVLRGNLLLTGTGTIQWDRGPKGIFCIPQKYVGAV